MPEHCCQAGCILLLQLFHVAQTLLRLKAWRLAYLLVSATLIFSGAYLSIVLSWYSLDSESELGFYRSVGLDTAWHLLSHKTSNQTGSLRLAVERGLPWNEELDLSCGNSARKCIQNLLSQMKGNDQKLLELIGKGSESPVMLECLASRNPPPGYRSLACSLLYQLAESQSSPKLLAFKEQSLLHLKLDLNASAINFSNTGRLATTHSTGVDRSGQKTVCSTSNKLFRTVVASSISISTVAATFYFTLSTAYIINRLKLQGFLKQQHHNGLYAIAFWLPILLVTLLESLLLTGVFVSGHMIRCPASLNRLRVSVVFLLHCLSLAMMAILSATIEVNFGETCLLMMLLNLILIGGFSCAPSLISQGFTAPLYVYPPLNAPWLIETHIASDGMKLLSPVELAHEARVLPYMQLTPIVLAIVIIYLDFVLPNGNGLCLPWYFPFSIKFWLPNLTHSYLSPTHSDDKIDRSQENFIEPMSPDSVPSAVLDDVSVVYRTCGCIGTCCSCEAIEALKHVSCEIFPGQITWLLGNNRSGKSTLLKLLSGFSHESAALPVVASGSVTLMNGLRMVTSLDKLKVRRKVAAMISHKDNDGICSALTVKRCLSMTLASRGCICDPGTTAATRDILARLDLEEVLDLNVVQLSPCQRQLFSLALTLISNSQLIVLDEPTSCLEPVLQQQVWRLLRDLCSQSASVSIVVSVKRRDMPAITPSERIIYLSHGQVGGIGSLQFLSNAFNCQRRCVTVKMLKVDDEVAAAATQKLLDRLPDGTEHVPSRMSHKLKLLVAPEALLQCLDVLESAVGELIADDGIHLGPTQPLALSRSIKTASQEGPSSDTTETTSIKNIESSTNHASSSNAVRKWESRKTFSEDVPHVLDRLNTSSLIRLCALCPIQWKRLARNKCEFVMRCVVPILLLACFIVLLAIQKKLLLRFPKAYSANQFEGPNSSAVAEKINSKRLRITCVYDALEGNANVLKFKACAKSNVSPMEKPPNVSLKTFLMQSAQQSKLLASCFKLAHFCAILHCSSWNRDKTPNDNRSVTVVLLEASNVIDAEERAYSYRQLIAEISDHFQAKLNLSHQVQAFKVQQSRQNYFSLAIIVLFLLMFSYFPASFFNEIADDFESNVYYYLKFLGVSRLNCICSTVFLHWLQYSTFFTLSVICFQSWDKFQNSFFMVCVYLPVIVFGINSNLLSVYTTVVLTGGCNKTITATYIAWVLLAPLTLVAVSNLGKVPVLALIWLIPQVAPLALIQFGSNMVNHRVMYNENSDDSLLYQVWDLHFDPWNYIFMVNSILAMPIHLIGLSLLLSASVSDVRRCIDQHVNCVCKFPPCHRLRQESATELEPLHSKQGPVPAYDNCVVDVRNLWKICSVTGMPIVKGIGFKLAAGQCMTLVGATGSGRSTIASMLAGETRATYGDCRIFCHRTLCLPGAEPWNHRSDCSVVGYCPRRTPLFHWLTVTEHLQFYARIRGLRPIVFRKRIVELISELGLTEYQGRPIGSLDDLRRRLVCLATALLARPLLLIIDNGCLGDARCFLRRQNEASWTSLTDIWGTAVVATADNVKDGHDKPSGTNSEEAESPSSDEEDDDVSGGVAIQMPGSISFSFDCFNHPNVFGLLYRGRITATGTAQQLRSICGNWYYLEVTMLPESATLTAEKLRKKHSKISHSILLQFRDSLLLEEYHRWLQFCLPEAAVGKLSGTLQWLKSNLTQQESVQHFHLYNMTLDEAIALQNLNVIKK